MQVYIIWDAGRRVHSVYSRASHERIESFDQRRDAIVYAVHQGWAIVRAPRPTIPMNGTDYHTFGEC